jgi:chromosome segregation ATPase
MMQTMSASRSASRLAFLTVAVARRPNSIHDSVAIERLEEIVARSVDQRTQELTEPSNIAGAWAGINGKFKELNAPIFKKNGDIGAVAKHYDALTKLFLDSVKKKNDVSSILEDGKKQVDAIGNKITDMKEEIDKIMLDEKNSTKTVDPKTPEDGLEQYDEAIKAHQDATKTRKSVFDNIMRLSDSLVKSMIDTRDKAKKELDAANARLAKANVDLESAEAQIRKMVVGYQKVAFDMDRKDIADGVRQVLSEFGK